MAHADYDCCAICDSKMGYNGGDAETKAAICVDCIERTAQLGTICTRPEHVLDHLRTLDDAAALGWLRGVGFDPCYYQNTIDDYLISRGLTETGIENGPKWGKRLKAA